MSWYLEISRNRDFITWILLQVIFRRVDYKWKRQRTTEYEPDNFINWLHLNDAIKSIYDSYALQYDINSPDEKILSSVDFGESLGSSGYPGQRSFPRLFTSSTFCRAETNATFGDPRVEHVSSDGRWKWVPRLQSWQPCRVNRATVSTSQSSGGEWVFDDVRSEWVSKNRNAREPNIPPPSPRGPSKRKNSRNTPARTRENSGEVISNPGNSRLATTPSSSTVKAEEYFGWIPWFLSQLILILLYSASQSKSHQLCIVWKHQIVEVL